MSMVTEPPLEAEGPARDTVERFAEYAALMYDELGDLETAERLFAPLAGADDVNFTIRRVRHALRMGRPEQASAIAEPMASSDSACALSRKPQVLTITRSAPSCWREIS